MISYNSRLLQETALDTACTGDALAENAALCELVSGNIVDTNCHTISLFFCSINVSPTLLHPAIYIGSKFLYINGCTGSHRFSDRSRSKRVFRAFRGKKLLSIRIDPLVNDQVRLTVGSVANGVAVFSSLVALVATTPCA